MADPVVRPVKILFICSRNRIRSLTAERLFSGVPGCQVKSAGTQPSARITVTEGHVRWADLIFVMERSHLQRIRARFPEAAESKQFVNLHIPDAYQFMQPELVDELQVKVAEHLQIQAP